MHRRDLLKLAASFAIPSAGAQHAAMFLALDAAGNDFFHRAKSMTAGIFYNTQIGYQELNKGGRVPSTFGCTHETHA